MTSERRFGFTGNISQPRTDEVLVTYVYDQGPHALGRLSQVTFPGGSRTTNWEYPFDDHRRVSS